MFFSINQSYFGKRWLQLLLALLFIGVLALPDRGVLAQDANTFVVNRTEDFVDAAPGNGACDADPNDKILQCTLRAAIMEANALTGTQMIYVSSGSYRLTILGKNENDSHTGDLDITSDLTIIGRGATQPVIDAAAIDRVFHVVKIDGTHVELENLTLRNGDAQSVNGGPGGGLLIESKSQVAISESAITDNVANSGGGIQMGRGAELTLDTVRVLNNLASDLGGGINSVARTTIRNSTISGNRVGQPGVLGAGLGGGLFAGGDQPIVIEQSTIASNTALVAAGGIGSVFVDTQLSVSNSTISGNSAPLAGGIKIEEPMTLQHVTIAHNSGGGLHVADANISVTLLNSIIANNSGGDCSFAAAGMALAGDRNLGSDNSCQFVNPALNLLNSNPVLGSLAANGGATQTHALLPGSPAINGGNNSGCPAVDQRGIARPQGPRCDIGAFEAQ